MPATFAHPSAILPLRRLCPTYLDFSALVIGSLAPDVGYFLQRFDLATALNAQGNRAEATNQLLEIIRRDRKWNEDGARKQLVQFFEAWGGMDEATVDGRKRLSTILFS